MESLCPKTQATSPPAPCWREFVAQPFLAVLFQLKTRGTQPRMAVPPRPDDLLPSQSSSLASRGCFHLPDLEAVWLHALREQGYDGRKRQEHSQEWLCHKSWDWSSGWQCHKRLSWQEIPAS